MITFSGIGNYGRFGNQLFQYAMLFGVSKRNGYDFCIPKNTNSRWKLELGEVFDGIRFGDPIGIERIVQEPNGCGTGIYLKEIETVQDNTDFVGYFQSPKYFEHCSNDIKEHLSIKIKYLNAAKSFVEAHNNLGFIHVRRGDYTNLSHFHPPISVEYIEAAIKISKAKKFVVLSDDIEWCKQNLSFIDPIYSPFSEMDVGYDFALMTQCQSAIIANSSFSWWGAWLGKQKDVIAPKRWFGCGDGIPQKWDEIYYKDWMVI